MTILCESKIPFSVLRRYEKNLSTDSYVLPCLLSNIEAEEFNIRGLSQNFEDLDTVCDPVYAFIQFALFVLFLFKDPYIDNNNSITEYFTMLKM